MKNLILKDFKYTFKNTTALVSLIVFSFVSALTFFLSYKSFYNLFMINGGDNAIEGVGLNYLTWISIYLIFLSSFLVHKIFQEDFLKGTVPLVLHKPIRVSQIIVSKFIGGMVAVFMLMLSSLFPVVISYFIIEFSMITILISYTVLFFYMALLVSVNILSSILAKGFVWGLMLGILLNITLLMVGLFINSPTKPNFLKQISISHHFDLAYTGVLNVGTFSFFATFTLTVLTLCWYVFPYRYMK